MFCDLVGSTALSEQLDPEDLREVMRAYHQTCADRDPALRGHIARYLGDGLLVYFGYPVSARRRCAAGRADGTGNRRWPSQHLSFPHSATTPLAGAYRHSHRAWSSLAKSASSAKREMLALGETPNLAARLQAWPSPIRW